MDAGTILIVDDQLSAREVLRGLLAGQGYHLVFAGNGEAALSQAADTVPDLVLLDAMMPGMDGFAVCQHLRADPLLGDVPVIMITALDDPETRLRGFELGVDDFLTKPFNQAELKSRVRTITRLNRQRKLFEERLRRQEAEAELALLKEAKRIKDQFVSNVSHELRTPISVITLLSGNLDLLYDRLDDQKRRKMIKDIRTHIAVLDHLISDILQISRIDAGGYGTEASQPVDMAQLLREEVEKLKPLAQEKGQQLAWRSDAPLWVTGHANQLRLILRNLLNNAIKYTPGGGQIHGKSFQSDAVAHLPGAWAVIEVTDTGIGIAAKDLPHLFERFFRVKPEGNIPGTGLGLAIVRELLDLHQGHITIDSSPGQGSTFTVYLPLAPQ